MQMIVTMIIDPVGFTESEILDGFTKVFRDNPVPGFEHRPMPRLITIEVHQQSNNFIEGTAITVG